MDDEQMDVDFALKLEPYFFINNLIKSGVREEVSLTNDISDNVDDNAYITFVKLMDVYADSFKSNRMNVYNFSDDLIELMKDNSVKDSSYFSLPFPCIFVNNKIYFPKRELWVTGILVVDNNLMPIEYQLKYGLKPNNLGLFYFATYKERLVHGFIPNFNEMLEEINSNNEFYIDLYHFIHSTINLLNVEHEDIISFTQNNTERNIKRVKKDKQKYPQYIKYIKLGGKTLKYAKAYSQAKKSAEYKSYVQGFFRTYKDDRYVNMQGKTQWIFPFVKGANLPQRPELQLIKVSATDEFMEKIKNE